MRGGKKRAGNQLVSALFLLPYFERYTTMAVLFQLFTFKNEKPTYGTNCGQ